MALLTLGTGLALCIFAGAATAKNNAALTPVIAALFGGFLCAYGTSLLTP